jgi:regulator of protease activity HflC (stomatin/prohibitin superfamily)
MITEKTIKPISGFLILGLLLLLAVGMVFGIIMELPAIIAPCGVLIALLAPGLFIINPNEAKVLTFVGTYSGTVKESGFYWMLPIYIRKTVSQRARNLNGTPLKVNDKIGNPIEIGAVIVWNVEDTAKAVFEVNNYEQYVNIQSEAAVRHLAGSCPYDNFEDSAAEVTLRSGTDKVNEMLEAELNERLKAAGIRVTEARISHLAYAPEIAGAMLKRQQATAIISARKLIVEGAVSMVETALVRLTESNLITFDDERKAAMVSNLLVVLCGDKDVTPVINTGTLYS